MISFSSDWLYPSYQSQEIVRALRARNCDVAYAELPSNYGHDSFLVDVAEQTELVRGFLASTFEKSRMSRRRVAQAGLRPRVAGTQRLRHHRRHCGARHARCSTWAAARANCCEWLAENKGVDARGVEISGAKVQRAIARGVSVFQGDIDEGLADYPDQAFDYVILSQTLQETRQPRQVLREMLRVGRRGNRGLSQFRPLAGAAVHAGQRACARARKLFPYDWYDSPNIHFLTVDDFEELARAGGPDRGAALLSGRAPQGDAAAESAGRGGGFPGAKTVAALAGAPHHWRQNRSLTFAAPHGHRKVRLMPNLLAEVVVFLVRRP